jgi:hypothetical protein
MIHICDDGCEHNIGLDDEEDDQDDQDDPENHQD